MSVAFNRQQKNAINRALENYGSLFVLLSYFIFDCYWLLMLPVATASFALRLALIFTLKSIQQLLNQIKIIQQLQ